MKIKKYFTKQLLSIFLCVAMILAYLPLTTFALNYINTVGDFTIAPSDSAEVLVADTDYTYADGVLTVSTTIPVTIGMKNGVTSTAETVAVDSSKGETTVTLNSIGIDTAEDAAIAVTGTNKVTLNFSGESSLSAADDGDGINVSSKTPIVFTSADNGKLNISGVKFGIFLDGYTSGGSVAVNGNLDLNITNCTFHAIYCRNAGSFTVTGTPIINIDTTEYAIYAHNIDISGGMLTLKNDDGYAITAASGTNIKLSGTADLQIVEGERGMHASGGKIEITDSAKYKVYGVSAANKTTAIVDCAIVSKELLINKNAIVDVFTKEDAISGGVTEITDNAKVTININCTSTSSQHAIRFDSPLEISGYANIDIDISGKKIYGLYDITDGTVNISDSAVVDICGAYRSVYADFLNLSDKAAMTITNDLNYAIYGATTLKDFATLIATSTEKKVLYDEFTVKPPLNIAYMVKTGSSEADATTAYYKEEATVSEKSTWRYFHAVATEKVPVDVSFNANGGTAIDTITVTYGEKYGKLPSSAITGLSGGDSNWYLVDDSGNVTDTKITRNSTVNTNRNHTLFVKRKVLAPTLKITIETPGAISNEYPYYVPDNSKRILTATVNNQNTEILDYTYQWYKGNVVIDGAISNVLTIEGNVADAGTYKVAVTATLKDGSGIIVTENTASAEKEQVVKIMRASNTLYYDANGGEGGPSNNFTNGDNIKVETDKPTREGYIFDCWNTKADGTGESYDSGDTYTFLEDNGNGGCKATLYAQWIKTYDVYVGGIQITDTNKDDVLGDGKVSYDAETATLTLNDAKILNGYEYKKDRVAGIYSGIDLNIELIGTENTVTAPDSNKISYGIKVSGNLNISGNGSITASGGNVSAQNTDADSIGIFTEGLLYISEAKVTANGGTATVSGTGTAYSSGVYTEGGLELDFDGYLFANGAKAQGSEAYSNGIEAIGSNDNYINISVYNGYLTAEGGEAFGTDYAGSAGIYISHGGLYLYETESNAELSADKAEVTSDKQDKAYAYSNGIYVFAGDVGVSDGKLDITSGSYAGVNGDAYGVYLRKEELKDENGNPYYAGGNFTVECSEVKPGLHTPNLVGTTVTINSPNGNAIHVASGINISDKLTISHPDKAEISGVGGSNDPDNWIEPDYWTVVDSLGAEAQKVIIKPLAYKVILKGLSYTMAVTVPAGESVNKTYCELFEIDDFSERLSTEKEGYTFGGWYKNAECTDGNEFTFNDNVNSDITLYAKWVVATNDSDKPSDDTQNDDDTQKDDDSTENGTESEKEDNAPQKDPQTDKDAQKDDNKSPDSTENETESEKEDNTSSSVTAPETSDNSNIGVWLVLLSVSVAGIFGITLYTRKKRLKATNNP